ncbi:hypothetical protein BDV18DRAFT_157260 [Aspergillus unguis]
MANTNRRFLSWDAKFTRRNEGLYPAESDKVVTFPGRNRVESFLMYCGHRLMPVQYSHAALREFLARDPLGVAKLEGTVLMMDESQDAEKTVLMDERRDPSRLNTSSSRYWAEYTQYPPEGEAIRSEALGAKGLYDVLKKKRDKLGKGMPERRTIYIRDISPLCALALALPVAARYAVALREFLFRYITCRAFFGVTIDHHIRPFSTYAFEFHIPFFALRSSIPGVSSSVSHLNRRKGEFQASFSACAGDEREFYHEVQTSVLLVGIDEWVWTVYCLVETHHSETGPEDVSEYIKYGTDAPSGQGVDSSMPIWNPREYFLLILSRRMSEVRFEWANLVQTLEARFKVLEQDIFLGPSTEQRSSQDDDLQFTNDYTWAIQVLQLFSTQIIKTIEAWDEFADRHLHIFRAVDTPADFLPKIPGYLESLDTDVSELRFLYRTIVRQIGAFESKRSNILNTSALVEARASNSQADNIGLLTKVTVFYLPLGLITSSAWPSYPRISTGAFM